MAENQNQGAKGHSRFLISEIWRRKRDFLLGLLATFLSAAVSLLIPGRAQVLISEVIPSGSLFATAREIGLILGIAALGVGLSAMRKYLLERLSHNLTTDLRHKLFAHVMQIPPRALLAKGGGEIGSTFSNDLQVFSEALRTVVSVIIPMALFVVIYSLASLWYSTLLFGALIVLMVPLLVTTDLLTRRMTVAAREAQERLGSLMTELSETMAGTKEIKLFQMEGRVLSRFGIANAKTLKVHLTREKLGTLYPFLISMTAAIGIAGLLLISLWLMQQGWLDLASLTGFIVCMGLLYGPLQEVSNSLGKGLQIFAALGRVEAILALPAERDMADLKTPAPTSAGVRFEGAAFGYRPEALQIHDLTLEIKAGEKVALVGPSGAGKSTALELLPRFLELSAGRILLGGTDIATLPLSVLRGQIGLVGQVPFLFRGTLMENLTVGLPGADPARVAEVAAMARVDEFAGRLPQGYDAMLETGGTNLSVGQRQRVAIARVLLKDPPLLLLDEPTSALDSESERIVSDAIAQAAEGRTTIIVAHRLSTIRGVDRVVVMEDGRVVEEAGYDALIAAGGAFARMAQAGELG